jgi:hypothetical protein
MAKADDTSSTIDPWLYDALMLAVQRFGSEGPAKRQLREWMATGEPWSSEFWYGPNAEDIARLDRENAENKYVGYFLPSGPYRQGDPQFWRANLEIRWEKNEAGERARGGAIASGIWVPRTRLLELLRRGRNPEARERMETPEPSEHQEAEQEAPKLIGKAWVPGAYKRRAAELGPHVMDITPAARALSDESKTAPDCVKPLSVGYCRNLLRDLNVWTKKPRRSL